MLNILKSFRRLTERKKLSYDLHSVEIMKVLLVNDVRAKL